MLTSIIIPSRTEKFLNNTINDILSKATGEIEVFPVLDGYGDTPYEPIIDKRVKYISLPNNDQRQKRMGINAAVSISKGKYVCWMDAHCVVAQGFDEVLAKDCDDDWAVVPRRYKMSLTSWDRKDIDNPIDYTYPMWQFLKKRRLAGYKWDIRIKERKDIMIDDILPPQGSFFFMTRKHFDRMRFLKTEGYTGWGQEGEEVCLATVKSGGRCIVNKNTWYAHLHKGQMHGRMYKWFQPYDSYEYSYNYWVNENRDFFVKTINKLMPIPNYPSNWEEKLYANT